MVYVSVYIDFRLLNAITKQDVFPLPRMDDTLDLILSAKYFTTLDLALASEDGP